MLALYIISVLPAPFSPTRSISAIISILDLRRFIRQHHLLVLSACYHYTTLIPLVKTLSSLSTLVILSFLPLPGARFLAYASKQAPQSPRRRCEEPFWGRATKQSWWGQQIATPRKAGRPNDVEGHSQMLRTYKGSPLSELARPQISHSVK